MFAGSGGYGFVATLADLVSRNKAGKAFLSLEDGELPLTPAKVNGATLAAISAAGRLLLFPLAELREMGKGRGLMIMDLDKKDQLAGIAVNFGNTVTISGTGRAGKTTQAVIEGKALNAYRAQRARKGSVIDARIKPTSLA